MKKLIWIFLVGVCMLTVHAQTASKTISLFGYALSCNTGIQTGHLLITNCSLPNAAWNDQLKIKITEYDGPIQPSQHQVEELLGNDKKQNKYLFSCPGTNRIIGGAISSNAPFEWIVMSTSTFLFFMEHASAKESFSSKIYLNELCRWNPGK